MNSKTETISDCVKRIMREDAELAAEKSCKHKRDEGLGVSHGTLSDV